MLLHQLKYKPLHVAMAVSLTLHISIAFNLFSTKKSKPTERVNIAGTRSFDTFIMRPSVVKVATNQSAESKVQAAEPSVTKVEKNEPVTTAVSESDQVQYRSSSFSRFGRSRPMNNGAHDMAAAFNQRVIKLQNQFASIAASPDLKGECSVTASNDWNDVAIQCAEIQDNNFLRAQLAPIARLKDNIPSLKHCLTIRKNQVEKKENCDLP
jgi:hypothetical protein